MPPFVMFFLMLGILIIIISLLQVNKRNEEAKRAEEMKFESRRREVLRIMYEKGKKADKTVEMPIRILKILEEINTMPKEFKEIYDSLEKDKLVRVDRDIIYLTELGESYVEVFINRRFDG